MRDFPPEIIHAFISSIEGLGLPRLRGVCKLWRQIIDSSTILQLQIELAIDGRFLPPEHLWKSSANPKDLLEQTRQATVAWETLMPRRVSEFKIEGPQTRYEVVDGLFAHGTPGPRNAVLSDGYKLTGAIELWELPNYTANGELRRVLKHADLGVDVIDFAIDFTQNLLVYFETRVKENFLHVRTLSTNEPHPEAANVGCHLAKKSAMQSNDIYINIGGSYVAILRSDPDNGLIIVDWRRCSIVAVVPSVMEFIFLGDDVGLAAVELAEHDEIALMMHQWSAPEHNRRMTLELPILRADSRYSRLMFTSHTNLLHPRYPITPSPIEPIRFLTQGHNIIAIDIFVDGPPHESEEFLGDSDFLLIIDLHALFAMAKPILDSDMETLAWENWGPLVARCIPLKQRPEILVVCNWRVVASEQAEHLEFTRAALKDAGLLPEAQDVNSTDRTARLIVFDFNSYRIRREAQNSTVTDSRIRWVPGDTMVLPALKEPVTGGIPYRVWMERDPTGFWAIGGAGDTLIAFEDDLIFADQCWGTMMQF